MRFTSSLYKTNHQLYRALVLGLMTASLLLSSLAHAQFWKQEQPELLPEDQAFVHDTRIEANDLVVDWLIAEDYYMYRDQFGIQSDVAGLEFGPAIYPQGVVEDDPEFGEVEVYFTEVSYRLPITKLPEQRGDVSLTLLAQGCNKPVGVCYPPQLRTISLDLSGVNQSSLNQSSLNQSGVDLSAVTASEQKANNSSSSQTNVDGFNAASTSQDQSFWAYLLAAFGAGLLLSFTPCVLPMIPILAGVIAGQENPSRWRSGWLAICYVAGTIVTYALAGWLAGATGTQLQAHFQNPWVIGFICALLLALAASLFGAFKIQLPSSIQTRLNTSGVSSRSASFSTFVLGLISALVVGACVSPILIINLGAAIAQGDPVLGAGIMASMALGMGLLLVAFGFGAGWLLPRAGAWMNEVQILFGFMVIGVAIYLASFINAVPALFLWAALLLWAGCYLLGLAARFHQPVMNGITKAASIGLIVWGCLCLIGASTGGDQVLKPLDNLAKSGTKKEKVPFQRVTTLTAAQALLDQAKAQQKPALIDFYADWCLDCVRMARTTFTEASVHSALADWVLIEVDVTQTNDESEALKQFFGVFGPPATLYVARDGQEVKGSRQYGYMDEQTFLARLTRAQ